MNIATPPEENYEYRNSAYHRKFSMDKDCCSLKAGDTALNYEVKQ